MARRPSDQIIARMEVVLAWGLIVACVVGWPWSQLTVAKDEPKFTLALSWLAILLTAVDYLKNSRAHKESKEQS